MIETICFLKQIEYRANARYVDLSAPLWCVIGPKTSNNKHSMLIYIYIHIDVNIEAYAGRRFKAFVLILKVKIFQ